jgi:hypothetical protein
MAAMDSTTRQVWVISAVIEATSAEADAAQEAIARALCPDDAHPGPCPVPWTTMAVKFEDLDDDQRRAWQRSFDEDRIAHSRTEHESR